MSIVGPRPLAVIYLDYYNDEEKKRHNGVAVASAITEFCVTLYQLWSIRKNVVFDVPKKFVISTLTGTVFMAIAVIICEMIIKSELVCIFIAIFVGVM